MEKISIIVPCYNEQEALPLFYQEITKTSKEMKNLEFEYLFVNDGSKDKTLEILRDLSKKDKRVRYISFSRNFGKEAAMYAGLENSTGDYVTLMDADLQDPPELIIDMYNKTKDGYDIVYGKRLKRENETAFKKFTAFAFYRVLNYMCDIDIPKDTGDFRLLDRRCVNALKKLRETERNTKSMFSWIGYKKKEVLYDRDARIAGKTKWSYMKLIDLAIDGITSLSTSPLRLSTWVAIPTFMVLIIYTIYVIAKCIITNTFVQAFQAIILLILFFSGIQILLFGIVGEYLGRIFTETKNRPLYFVNEYNGEKEMNN